MTTVASVVDWFNLALFSALGIVALVQWRSGRGRAGLWAAPTRMRSTGSTRT